jgi:hypothetical protein
MGFLTWQELTNPAYGNGTAIGSAINAAGGFVCDMYRRFPRWLFPDPTGFGAVVQGISDRLCSGAPAPEPQEPYVPGGKCNGVLYRVTFNAKLFGAPPIVGATVDLYGPVTRIGYYPLSTGLLAYGLKSRNQAGTAVITTNLIAQFTPADIESGAVSAEVLSIVRLDGQPDDCGGQAPTWAPSIPTLPDLNRTAPVVIAPGITIITPMILIRPSLNINVNATANINIQPTINLPDIGLNINFQVGGVNVNNSFNIGGGDPPLYLPDPRPNPPLLPPGGSTDVDLSDLYNRLRDVKELAEDIKACACEEFSLTPVGLSQGRSGTVSLPPLTEFVVLEMIETPPGAKFQAGLDAPDVLYAGWAWYGYQPNHLSQRDPVDASRKAFFPTFAPAQFSWTLYAGFRARVTAYVRTAV